MQRRHFLQYAGRAGAGMGIAAQTALADRPRRAGIAPASASGLVVSLDTGWVIATDAQNIGRQQSWFQNPQPQARPIRVPSIIQEAFPAYHGVAWYWLKFEPQPHPYREGRFILRFNAVDYLADVWLNSTHLGAHEGGETPFEFDATGVIQPGKENLLSVRVLNPDDRAIDGIVLKETPHRNKFTGYQIGALSDYGGVIEPVELLLTPSLRIADLYLRPDWKSGLLQIRTDLLNASNKSRGARISFTVCEAGSGNPVAIQNVSLLAAPGRTSTDHAIQIGQHRLWELHDPYLYRLTAGVESEAVDGVHQASVRFGFRDFRVVNGYFRLNGRRLFLKSTHTGNHVPFGQDVPPPGFPDLVRRDMLNAKTCGFNTVRFISGVAFPYELDICDEIGLLVYEEAAASWLLQDSPQMKRRYESSVSEMILRDRNHPSLVMWGMLNETKDGPVFREAKSALPMARSLDETRLILLSSGRFDGDLGVGSVSNPGSSQWEYMWGEEAPGAGQVPIKYPSGVGIGDFHLYPTVPQTPEANHMIRTLGQSSKPVFISEYGIGSMLDAIHEARMYEQAGIPSNAEGYVLMKSMADRLEADWVRFGMETAYPSAETLLRMSQLHMVRHRLLGFNLIRSNPKICGFNLTGMLDHAFTGEGVWRFWRDWKPGAFDAMCDGWAPVRWCLFAEPSHTYSGSPVKLEAVLANEDALLPGDYAARFRVWGPDGIAWDHTASFSIQAADGEKDPPLAYSVLQEEVTLQGPAGSYELIPSIQRGAAPPETSWRFYRSDRITLPKIPARIVTWGLPDRVMTWLEGGAAQTTPLNSSSLPNSREVILIGDVSHSPSSPDTWRLLASRIAMGSTAVFLSPKAFQRDRKSTTWLPLATKGRVYEFHDWLYHKECVAKPHPVFDGLQGRGILDWGYYGPVLPVYLFDGQDTPAEVIAAAFAAGYSTPGGYASGVLLASYPFIAGKFFVNSFEILDNLNTHPAADRLLLNLVQYAAAGLDRPSLPLPQDFDLKLKQIGYSD